MSNFGLQFIEGGGFALVVDLKILGVYLHAFEQMDSLRLRSRTKEHEMCTWGSLSIARLHFQTKAAGVQPFNPD